MQTWTFLKRGGKGAIDNRVGASGINWDCAKLEHMAILPMGDCNMLPSQHKQLC